MNGSCGVTQIRELLDDLERVNDVSYDSIPGILAQLAALQIALAARLVQKSATEPAGDNDRLVDVQEAAEKLGFSTDWLYKHHHRLPFTVKVGGALRFSQFGIDRWIRNKSGK